jgi:hypothetical protein
MHFFTIEEHFQENPCHIPAFLYSSLKICERNLHVFNTFQRIGSCLTVQDRRDECLHLWTPLAIRGSQHFYPSKSPSKEAVVQVEDVMNELQRCISSSTNEPSGQDRYVPFKNSYSSSLMNQKIPHECIFTYEIHLSSLNSSLA